MIDLFFVNISPGSKQTNVKEKQHGALLPERGSTSSLRCPATHLQSVDARPDVVVGLITQWHQSSCVCLHPLVKCDLQRKTWPLSYGWLSFVEFNTFFRLLLRNVLVFLFICVSWDLCQSLRQAGRLRLRKRQEERLLPQRSESWNVTKGKEKSSERGCKDRNEMRTHVTRQLRYNKIYNFHTRVSYRSLQMQMIGRSRIVSFFFFFFASASPCPSFLFRTANSMLMAACRTGGNNKMMSIQTAVILFIDVASVQNLPQALHRSRQ